MPYATQVLRQVREAYSPYESALEQQRRTAQQNIVEQQRTLEQQQQQLEQQKQSLSTQRAIRSRKLSDTISAKQQLGTLSSQEQLILKSQQELQLASKQIESQYGQAKQQLEKQKQESYLKAFKPSFIGGVATFGGAEVLGQQSAKSSYIDVAPQKYTTPSWVMRAEALRIEKENKAIQEYNVAQGYWGVSRVNPLTLKGEEISLTGQKKIVSDIPSTQSRVKELLVTGGTPELYPGKVYPTAIIQGNIFQKIGQGAINTYLGAEEGASKLMSKGVQGVKSITGFDITSARDWGNVFSKGAGKPEAIKNIVPMKTYTTLGTIPSVIISDVVNKPIKNVAIFGSGFLFGKAVEGVSMFGGKFVGEYAPKIAEAKPIKSIFGIATKEIVPATTSFGIKVAAGTGALAFGYETLKQVSEAPTMQEKIGLGSLAVKDVFLFGAGANLGEKVLGKIKTPSFITLRDIAKPNLKQRQSVFSKLLKLGYKEKVPRSLPSSAYDVVQPISTPQGDLFQSKFAIKTKTPARFEIRESILGRVLGKEPSFRMIAKQQKRFGEFTGGGAGDTALGILGTQRGGATLKQIFIAGSKQEETTFAQLGKRSPAEKKAFDFGLSGTIPEEAKLLRSELELRKAFRSSKPNKNEIKILTIKPGKTTSRFALVSAINKIPMEEGTLESYYAGKMGGSEITMSTRGRKPFQIFGVSKVLPTKYVGFEDTFTIKRGIASKKTTSTFKDMLSTPEQPKAIKPLLETAKLTTEKAVAQKMAAQRATLDILQKQSARYASRVKYAEKGQFDALRFGGALLSQQNQKAFQIQEFSPKQMQKIMQQPKFMEATRQIQTPKQIQEIKQAQIPKQLLQQKASIIQRQKQIQTPKVIPKPVITTPPKDEGGDNRKIVKALKELGNQGVDVIVGYGKTRRTIAKNVPKFKGLKEGLEFIDKRIEATMNIKPSGQKPKGKDIKLFTPSIKFRPSKRSPLDIVEKRRYRLDNPFEKQTIRRAKR